MKGWGAGGTEHPVAPRFRPVSPARTLLTGAQESSLPVPLPVSLPGPLPFPTPFPTAFPTGFPGVQPAVQPGIQSAVQPGICTQDCPWDRQQESIQDAVYCAVRATVQKTVPSPSGLRCCREGVARNDDRNDDKRSQKRKARHDSMSHRASSCPSWDRTRTLLIQSQACCQLHQGAMNWTQVAQTPSEQWSPATKNSV